MTAQKRTRRPTILCVDDDPELLDTLEHLLARIFPNHHIAAAISVKDGLEQVQDLIQQDAPLALALSDQVLSDGLGTDLLAQIKTFFPATPRVMFTGFADTQTAVKGIRVGIDDFLEKPISESTLRRALLPLIRRYNLSQDRQKLTQRAKEHTLRFSRLLDLAFRDVDRPLQQLLSSDAELSLVESDLRRAQENLALLWRTFEAHRLKDSQESCYFSAREIVQDAADSLSREGELGLALDEAFSFNMVESCQNVAGFGNPALSRMAIARILHNAWRFSPKDLPTTVIIRGPNYSQRPTDSDIRCPEKVLNALKRRQFVISISNAGAMKEQDYNKIRSSLDPHSSGPLQGLGIVMAQELLQSQGGNLFFEATPGEDGATFHLSLPAASAQ